LSRREKPVIGITMGDPLGIGPEVIAKALGDEGIRRACTPLVIGDAEVLRTAWEAIAGAPAMRTVASPSEAIHEAAAISVLDLANARNIDLRKRAPTAAAGRAAREAIEQAARMATAREIDGMVTAPINKEAMRLAGYERTGHTEMLGHLTGTEGAVMLLVWGKMRVAHVTTHLPLREVPDAITQERVLHAIEVTHDTLQQLGVAQPRIAVAGLNPHAGEGGLFGEEESKAIAPAVADARLAGWDVTGPLPPDTVFAQLRGGLYDAVVAMYHDQGHVAIKTLSFTPAAGDKGAQMAGVNVTMGLPIIRTSVDHGTAFDIAGKGIASEQSMKEAILLAAHMARGRG